MNRTYMVLLVVLMTLVASTATGAPTSERSVQRAVEPPHAAPINDAGLWLTLGGATFTVVTAGTAIVYDRRLVDIADFDDKHPDRVIGLTSAFLAIMGAATTATGVVFLFWPAEGE